MPEGHISEARREFLRKSTAAVTSSGVLCGTASATDREWQVYLSESDRASGQADTIYTTTEYNDSLDIPEVTASLGAGVRASSWGSVYDGGPNNYFAEMKMSTTSATDGSDVIAHSQQTTSWDGPDALSVQSESDADHIGGYDGGNYEGDTDEVVESVAKAGLSALTSTAVSVATSFTGAGIASSLIFALVDSYTGDNSSYNREWDWNGLDEASVYTFYTLKLSEGESMNIDQAHLTNLDIPFRNAQMFSGFNTDVSPPGYITFSTTSFSSLTGGSYSQSALLKKERDGKRDLYVSSGKFARENPGQFAVPDSRLRTVGDDDIILQTPVNMETRPTRQIPSSFN